MQYVGPETLRQYSSTTTIKARCWKNLGECGHWHFASTISGWLQEGPRVLICDEIKVFSLITYLLYYLSSAVPLIAVTMGVHLDHMLDISRSLLQKSGQTGGKKANEKSTESSFCMSLYSSPINMTQSSHRPSSCLVKSQAVSSLLISPAYLFLFG